MVGEHASGILYLSYLRETANRERLGEGIQTHYSMTCFFQLHPHLSQWSNQLGTRHPNAWAYVGHFTSKLWPKFSTKMFLEWFRGGKSVLFLRIVLLCLLYLSLMLSGLFQIDFCYHGGFPCLPRSNTDKPSLTAAANIRPGSPGRMKAWAVGHFARTTKLTAGTQMRVGKQSSLFIQRVLSLCGTALSFIWVIWIIYFPYPFSFTFYR